MREIERRDDQRVGEGGREGREKRMLGANLHKRRQRHRTPVEGQIMYTFVSISYFP